LGALLVAAKLDLARLKARLGDAEDYIKERLFHLGQALSNGISLKRRIIEELHPSSLSKLGLVAALEILIREFAARTGMSCDSELEPVTLAPAAELTVYRLVQEALTNIAKHAEATRVEIRLSKQPLRAHIEVQDNGKGFDTTQASTSSHGLEGMQYRVAANGGSMLVHSAVGEGTLIAATIPLLRNTSV
jgi:signal transduction histidine kinase